MLANERSQRAGGCSGSRGRSCSTGTAADPEPAPPAPPANRKQQQEQTHHVDHSAAKTLDGFNGDRD